MKIIFMGQNKFGERVLKKFHEETNHKIVATYCVPDKDKKSMDLVKKYAQNHAIPLFQPLNFDEEKIIDKIKSHDADLCIMAYVNIFIPKAVRNIPKHGTICFHPSLLPLHRGPSSINWPIIQGDKKTGLTIFYPNDKFDEGDILLQKEVEINPDDTLGDIYFSKIFPLGVNLCVEAANLISDGRVTKITQDESKASYQSWCKKSDAKINWNKPGREIYNLIRGCNPQPGAWSYFMGNEFVFFDTKFKYDRTVKNPPGQIISISKNDINIAVKEGVLIVSRFKSDQEKLYVKDMNTKTFSEGDFFL